LVKKIVRISRAGKLQHIDRIKEEITVPVQRSKAIGFKYRKVVSGAELLRCDGR
jgi:hypothetical protein